MPFEIIKKTDGYYYLYNLHKQKYAKARFKTFQSAVNQGKNYARYRHERLKLVGNRLVRF